LAQVKRRFKTSRLYLGWPNHLTCIVTLSILLRTYYRVQILNQIWEAVLLIHLECATWTPPVLRSHLTWL